MTCTLILTRHAKSCWNSDAPSDHSRPLNERGQLAAKALGSWIKEYDYHPTQVISSSSQRTRETYQLMQLETSSIYLERLYHASAEVMFQVLKEAETPRTLILGHNPGIASFAHQIVSFPPDHSRFEDYPTGATLVADFPIESWSELTWGSGIVRDFAVPRELLGASPDLAA